VDRDEGGGGFANTARESIRGQGKGRMAHRGLDCLTGDPQELALIRSL
jgi:hypothetical protein